MSRDMTPLRPSGLGNGSRMRTMEFDEADSFMIFRTLVLGSATALLYQNTDQAMCRLEHYAQQFKAFAPDAAKHLDHDYSLCEIVIAMETSATWSIHRVKQFSWSDRFTGIVTVDRKAWETEYRIDQTAYDEVIAMLLAIAPLACAREEREDVIR